MQITKNNKTDYVYFDDPNELVDRLELLVSEKSARNNFQNNEIQSIIEELYECGLIINKYALHPLVSF